MPARIRKTDISGHGLRRLLELPWRNSGIKMGRLASQDSMPPLPRTWAPGERLLFIVVLLGGALFLYRLAKPLLHGSVYVFGDMGFFHLPLRQFYADCLAKGDNFHWIPWLFCGYYVHGEGQVGMYHPLHLLLYGLLPLNWAFNFEYLLHFVSLPCGAYFWLRGWLPRRDGALLGALLFTFSGFTLGHSGHINAAAIIAHLPWLLLATDRLIDDSHPWRRAAAGLGLGLLMTSHWLLGYPQYVLMNTLVEGVYLLWRLPGWRRLAEVVTAHGLGLLAGCVQFLPTWETLRLSVRSAPDVHFAGTLSLQPFNLAQLFFPHSLIVDSLGEGSLLNGLFVTAGLLSLWPLRHWGKAGKLAWLALPLAGLGFFLALGRFNPLFPLYATLPGVSVFRCPARFSLLFHFAAAIGAAVLWCRLAQAPGESRPPAWKGLAWFLLPAVLVWPALSALRPVLVSVRQSTVWTEDLPMLCEVDRGGIARGVVWTAVLAVLLVLALRNWRPALAGLLVFVAADQYTLVRWAPKMPAASLAEVCARAVPPVCGNACRLYSPDLNANQLSVHRVRLTNGYVALSPRRCLDYSTPAACQVAGVAWKWQDGLWQRVEGLPRVRLVSRALVCAVPSQAIGQSDVVTTALVSEPLELDGGPPGTATLVSDRPGRVSIAVESPSRQLLVLGESFHPGWRLKVDGERRRPVAVYGDFLGCEVGPGLHQVEFFFQPFSLRLGAALSALGVTLLVVWFVWTGWISGRKMAWMPDTSTS
jgi:hypothetical protein